jgi:imidazolonepropionase-like amidohydrolase
MKRNFSLRKSDPFDRREFLQCAGMLAGGVLSGSLSPGVARLGAYPQRQGASTAASALTAFVDVTVVPMDRERLVEHQTVLVRGERIAEVGSAGAVAVPAGALRIDGRSHYLMPGLADMHVHYDEPEFNIFYVANGVTTVRSMWGRRQDLVERTRIAKGETLGPTIFTCGPIMSSQSAWGEGSVAVSDPQEAERAVADQKAAGFDFVKVTDVSSDVYDAIVAAAKRHNLPVVGHIPRQVGLFHALKSGHASIEHLTGYLQALVRESAPAPPELVNAPDWGRAQMALEEYVTEYGDESKIPSLARATREAGAWNCATLGIFTDYNLEKRPGIRFVPSSIRKAWAAYATGNGTQNPPARSLEIQARANELRVKITRALRDAGARILLGTDMVVWGFSLHEELHYLVRAGLTPYEAIRAGTYDVADFLHALDDFGTVAVGRRADLILAEANPLQDVANVARRVGVMVRGRWLSESELQTRLEDIGAK